MIHSRTIRCRFGRGIDIYTDNPTRLRGDIEMQVSKPGTFARTVVLTPAGATKLAMELLRAAKEKP